MTETTPTDLELVRSHVRILVDLGKLAAQDLETTTFLDQAAIQVARATHVDHAKILQYRPDHSDLFMIAGMGWRDGIIRSAAFSTDLASAPGRCFKTAEPVIIDDVNAQSEFRLSPILIDHDIVSLANVPMLVDGAAWGVLEVDSSKRRDFGADTSEFMTAAAAIVGAGLRRRKAEQTAIEGSIAAVARSHQHDVYLKEMQHRVKNNFQLILASITMQKKRTADKDVRAALDGIADRINAISVAHDQLAPGQDGKTVNAAGYLTALSSSIMQQTDRVAIEVQAEELLISIDRIVPLGLILNELATNSIKHAFAGGAGRIEVNLMSVGDGQVRLTVSDNGSGFKRPRAEGSGLKLISSLARQIGGSVDQNSSENGTITAVVFSVIG